VQNPEEMATVAVVGDGGREHALAWAVAKSPDVRVVYCGGVVTQCGGKVRLCCPIWDCADVHLPLSFAALCVPLHPLHMHHPLTHPASPSSAAQRSRPVVALRL
jgi:hypothetical protein